MIDVLEQIRWLLVLSALVRRSSLFVFDAFDDC